jgi:hypothetical protein
MERSVRGEIEGGEVELKDAEHDVAVEDLLCYGSYGGEVVGLWLVRWCSLRTMAISTLEGMGFGYSRNNNFNNW